MSKRSEEFPVQSLHPPLASALLEIGSGNFRLMTDNMRPEVVCPVMYEPVFFDEDDSLVSQRAIYTSTVAKRPKALKQVIDRVANALDLTSSANNVKCAIEHQAAYDVEQPEFLQEILPVIKAQKTNTARVVGGLLMVKDAETSRVGLRCVYNRALMEVSTAWHLRDLALVGLLGGSEAANGIKAHDPDAVGEIAARMALHCLQVSRKLKPAVIYAPNVGIRGL